MHWSACYPARPKRMNVTVSCLFQHSTPSLATIQQAPTPTRKEKTVDCSQTYHLSPENSQPFCSKTRILLYVASLITHARSHMVKAIALAPIQVWLVGRQVCAWRTKREKSRTLQRCNIYLVTQRRSQILMTWRKIGKTEWVASLVSLRVNMLLAGRKIEL